MLLSPAPRDAGSGHWKKRLAHSSAEHDAPSPEVNVPSDASRHPSAVQHEHLQSSSPQGGGGGQATEASKWALTLPGEFEFDGAAISPGDGHLRMVTYEHTGCGNAPGAVLTSPLPPVCVGQCTHACVLALVQAGACIHACSLTRSDS